MKDEFYRVILDKDDAIDVTVPELDALDIVKDQNGGYHLIHDDKSYNMSIISFDMGEGKMRISVNDEIFNVQVKDSVRVRVDELGLSDLHQSVEEFIVAPMPGLVLGVMVRAGEEVKKGDTLLILEAMKMENVIAAPHDAHIEEVYIKNGISVEKSEKLIKLT